jgi:hypothetical protein
MKASTAKLDRLLSLVDAKLKRTVRNATNHTAFEMRKQTPAYLTKAIDKPVPFTRGIGVTRVDRASTSGSLKSIKATLRVSPLQAKYLAIQEHGGVKADGAVAVRSNARDAFGNVRKAFHRTSAGLDRLTGKRGKNGQAKFFVGKPSGRGVGIYEREGDKLQLVTAFIKRVKFQPRVGLRAHPGRRQGDARQRGLHRFRCQP